MFGRRPSPSDLELGAVAFGEQAMQQKPQDHKTVGSTDINDCPYMKIQQQQQQDSEPKKVEIGPDGKPKKVKKPRGGCPLMPSEHKRNPGLYHMTESFDTEFISIYNYMLDQRGLLSFAFNTKEMKKGPIQERRKVFNTYPIYLKHTLFQDEENTKKMRTMEVAQRFFVYDKFREQGNKRLHKGEYDEAMKYYERALGCFKWLEYVEPVESDSDDENQKKQKNQEADQEKDKDLNQEIYEENDTDNEKIPFNRKEPEEEKIDPEEEKKLQEEVNEYKKHQKELKKQYKSMMKVYTDETVKLFDPADIEDTNDKEMVASVLFTLYLCMCVCYMHMSHFNLAQKVLEDASKIQETNSQVCFRKSQVLSYDNWASLDQLYKSKTMIEKAIELTNYEKIFQQQPGILKLMNLHNAKEIYVEQAHIVMKKIDEKKESMRKKYVKLIERALEIEDIEKEMIEDGKIPFEDGVSNVVDEEDQLLKDELQHVQQNGAEKIKQEGPENNELQQETPQEKLKRLCAPQFSEEQQEYSIVLEMVNKYYRIIEFYTEQRKYDQVAIAKKELQRLLVNVQEMHFYMNSDFIDYENNEVLKELQVEYKIDFTNKKIIRRLLRLCREEVTEIFGKSTYNFEVLDYAMKDYFKKKDDERKKLEEQDEIEQPLKKKSWISKHIFSWDFLISIFVFAILAGAFIYFNNNTKIFKNLGQKK